MSAKELFKAGDVVNVVNDQDDITTPKPVKVVSPLSPPNGDRFWRVEGTKTGVLERHLRHANHLLGGALRCACRGWPVFPGDPEDKRPVATGGKHPNGELKRLQWKKAATTDTDQIRRWWAKWQRANVCVTCGSPGPFVVDVDAAKPNDPSVDGRETWAGLCQQHEIDDDHAIVSLTGSGGKQLFYNADGLDLRNTTSKLGPGIDTRGTGGYVVVPPSIHPNGKPYVWELSSHPDDNVLCSLPDVLLALLKKTATKKMRADPLPDRIMDGTRNESLFSFACSMRRRDASKAVMLAALVEMNTERCDPPLPLAELESIVKSASGYEPEEEHKLPPVTVTTKRVSTKTVEAAFSRAETGDAELLAQMFGGLIIYDHGRKTWYKWNEHRWVEDRTLLIRRLVSGPVAAQYYRMAGIILEKLTSKMDKDQEKEIRDKAKNYAKRANSLRYKNRINNVLTEATAVTTLALTGDEWDSDPWLLGVGNGVVDLRTGELRDGKPEDYIRKFTPVNWQPDAGAPRWYTFLQEVFDGDQDLIAFIQRLLGYGITGTQIEHVFPIWWGEGRNGKDTTWKALKNVLGTHAKKVSTKLITRARPPAANSATPYLVGLQGLRLCLAGETREDAKLNIALIKEVTGGGEQAGRPLYGSPISFMPSHLLMLATNHKPEIDADEYAAWARVLLVPFTQKFVDDPQGPNEHQQDKNLDVQLKTEASGILRWLVEGCHQWQIEGLNPPDVVKIATEEYRQEEDLFEMFLSECCYRAPDVEEKTSVLYKEYLKWCKDYKRKPMTINAFGRRMGKMFKRTPKRDGKWYEGVSLSTGVLL